MPDTIAMGWYRALYFEGVEMRGGYRMGSVAWRWIDDDIADLSAANTLHDARPHPPGTDDAAWQGEPTEHVRINR